MDPKEYETIRVEVDERGIGVLTFNRPEVRNALNLTMVEEIRDALRILATEEGLKVLILTGAGEKAFMGGVDIAELRERGAAEALQGINSNLFREVEQFPAPTIAAMRGFVLGGGCELAMACDLRVCTEGARFGQPEVGLGILPGAGATYRMPRLIGLGRTKELVYTGRIIDSGEALEIGLVNRVVSEDGLMDGARELAGEIARNSNLAVRLAKRMLAAFSETTDSMLTMESGLQAVLFEDPEKMERMTAFLEKRKKKEQGR